MQTLRVLEEQDVEVFGYQVEYFNYDYCLNLLYKHILVRHEQAAVHAAGYESTGKGQNCSCYLKVLLFSWINRRFDGFCSNSFIERSQLILGMTHFRK